MIRPWFVVGLLAVSGCASSPPTAEETLAKQITHCGVVATNLGKTDPKYQQWASNFLGAAQTLAPTNAVMQMMMDDPSTPPKTPEQRAAAEKEVEGCQKLMFDNMDKFGKGDTSTGRSRFFR